ncbi:MAG: type II toxin-antitoxin system Phd/YefM family antitoxin [Actinobacteria bacterium]|nr:type II toxin-antitoxin system Phd/YefM family antitoxin [Actinomycetota bacterium]
MIVDLYSSEMDVSVTELRAHLAAWIAQVQQGEEVTITDHGRPVARLVPAGTAARIKDLIERGVLGRPQSPVRQRISKHDRVPMSGTLEDLPRDEWR